MATCPRCFGALTENHRCPRGRFARATDGLLIGLAGAAAGAIAVLALEDQPADALVLAAAALGAVLATAIRRALSPRI
jgi:hypothetical protein